MRTQPNQEQQASGSEQAEARAAIAEKARRKLNSLLLEAVDVLEKELKGPNAVVAAAQILTLGLQNPPPTSKSEDLLGLFAELLRGADPTEKAIPAKAPRRRDSKTKGRKS